MRIAASFFSIEEAEIARCKLSACDIRSFVQEHHDPYPGAREIHLHVDDEDFDAALKLLATIRSGQEEFPEDAEVLSEKGLAKFRRWALAQVEEEPLEPTPPGLTREFWIVVLAGSVIFMPLSLPIFFHAPPIPIGLWTDFAGQCVTFLAYIALITLFLTRRGKGWSDLGFSSDGFPILCGLFLWYFARLAGEWAGGEFHILLTPLAPRPSASTAEVAAIFRSQFERLIDAIWRSVALVYIADTARRLRWSPWTVVLPYVILESMNFAGRSGGWIAYMVGFYLVTAAFYIWTRMASAVACAFLVDAIYIFLINY